MAYFTAYLERFFALLLPARGRHRAGQAEPYRTWPEESERPRVVSLPRHRSRYACDAVSGPRFPERSLRTRPYVLAQLSARGEGLEVPDGGPEVPERWLQAYRRWVLDMAVRGYDVGPEVIHGVRVGTRRSHQRAGSAVATPKTVPSGEAA